MSFLQEGDERRFSWLPYFLPRKGKLQRVAVRIIKSSDYTRGIPEDGYTQGQRKTADVSRDKTR